MTGPASSPLLPLEGAVVVEIGGSLCARLLVKLLRDQGAHVDCVTDANEIGRRRTWDDREAVRSLALGTDAGRRTLVDLVDGADVLIDGLDASERTRWGLAPLELEVAHPRLVHLLLTPFPAARAGEPVATSDWETSVAADLGLWSLHGGTPQQLPVPLASSFGSMYGAIYVASALLERDRHGLGSTIDLSLFGSAIMALSLNMQSLATKPGAEEKGPFRTAGDLRYVAGDNRVVQITANVPAVASALFAAIGKSDWASEGLADLVGETPERNEEFWRERLSAVFRTKPAREWEELISATHGACALCRTNAEWKNEPHAVATGILVTADGGALDGGRVDIGPAVRLYEQAASPAASVPIRSGRASVSKTPRDNSLPLPLEGRTVVELSVVLAGPSGGRILGELGARVIKVDAPHRSASPFLGQMGWLDVNRTKESILLDLRTAAGRDALWRLVEDADIVLQSFRTGKVDRLGFGFEAVIERNPTVVYVSLNAYDFGGPFSDRPGWEPLAQAMTGMEMAARADGIAPRVQLPLNDFGTGALCAYGALLGLRTVQRTGRGVHVMGSLTRTATFHQTSELAWSVTVPGNGSVGHAYLDGERHFIQCSDGWLVAWAEDGSPVTGILERSELIGGGNELDRTSVIDALSALGLKSALVRGPKEVPGLAWARDSGHVGEWVHPHWGSMTNIFPGARANRFSVRRGWPAADPGEDTRSVLRDVGYADEDIAALEQAGAAQSRTPLF